MDTKIIDVVSQAASNLLGVCNNEQAAQQEAWWLVEKVTGSDKTHLLLNFIFLYI